MLRCLDQRTTGARAHKSNHNTVCGIENYTCKPTEGPSEVRSNKIMEAEILLGVMAHYIFY